MQQIELNPQYAVFSAQTTLKDLGTTHFIGIGGSGMSVLAEMLHEYGVDVQGSDRSESAKTDRLASLGIRVFIGQEAEHVKNADTVVYSSAIKPENPEIQGAIGHAQIVHRSDILSLLMQGKQAISVAGAHGKTTTSSMVAHMLTHAGTGEYADPSYAIGGSIQSPDGTTIDGGHAGSGSVLVAEADESDGSFDKYSPAVAIITNVEADHLDHYHTIENYRQAFIRYANHATKAVVICADDEGSRYVLDQLDAQVLAHTYVITTDTNYRHISAKVITLEAHETSENNGNESFSCMLPTAQGEQQLRVDLAIPGIHNARNAALALCAIGLLGADTQSAAQSLSTFLGAARRFDIRGVQGGVTVVDDYAHHPTEIAALISATRTRYPQARLHVLFQPHLFSRTREFAHEFAQSLLAADDVVLTDIFPAREKQEDFPDVSSATIALQAKEIQHENGSAVPVAVVPDMSEAAHEIASHAHYGDVIFTVGAGSITSMAQVLLDDLKQRAN